MGCGCGKHAAACSPSKKPSRSTSQRSNPGERSNNTSAKGPQKGAPQIRETSETDFAAQLSKATSLDDFMLMNVLGTGQFGCVKLARHKPSSAVCAMKICNKARGHYIKGHKNPYESLAGRVLMKINHPFVIRTYVTFWSADQICTLMQLADGGDLHQHLKMAGKFSVEETKFYTAQILLGLEALHKHNVVYHDLKPDNCLLTKEGNIKLIDFGLSAIGIAGNRRGCTHFGGSPAYMAPEIHEQEPHDVTCDWWSFAVMTYEMLAGVRPGFTDDWETDYPSSLSSPAKSLLKGLLVREPAQRICSRGGADNLKKCSFFKGVSFSDHMKGNVRPVSLGTRSALGNACSKQTGFQAANNIAAGSSTNRRFTIGESSTPEGIAAMKKREAMKGTVAGKSTEKIFERARKRRSSPGPG